MNRFLIGFECLLLSFPVFASKPVLSLVTIPAGKYWVGCDVLRDSGCSAPERPGQSIDIDSFKISKFEITQGQYEACVKEAKCRAPKEDFEPMKLRNFPVVNVTWFQANEFCEWLGMQLPSEIEWEVSARGPDGRIYPWGNEDPDCKKANSNYMCHTNLRQVASFPEDKGPFGLQDMAGNVEEWVSNWYSKEYWNGNIFTFLKEGTPTKERAVRGGSFNSDSWHSRLTHRFYSDPNHAAKDRGFRCLNR